MYMLKSFNMGMEGTGRTSVYDDRIFALASLLSSVLIYNLPFTDVNRVLETLTILPLNRPQNGIVLCLSFVVLKFCL